MTNFWKPFLISQGATFLHLKWLGHETELLLFALSVVLILSIPNFLISVIARNEATYNKWFWINYVFAAPVLSYLGFMYYAAVTEWGEMVVQYPNMFGLWILITFAPILWFKPKAI